MKRVIVNVKDGRDAAALAAALIGRWFECDPMPDDWYQFTIKPEAWASAQGILSALFAVYQIIEPYDSRRT